MPIAKIGCDLFEYKGKDYLIIIDYYSKWIEFEPMKNKTSREVINKWTETFARFGIPGTVISDNVPFNSTECREFAEKWGFKIITSSPLYPKSNGLAERADKLLKTF